MGNSRVRVAGPSSRGAKVAPDLETVCSSSASPTSPPTLIGRAGFPSMAIKAKPWSCFEATTPLSLKRPALASGSTEAEAATGPLPPPKTRAIAMASGAGKLGTGNGKRPFTGANVLTWSSQ